MHRDGKTPRLIRNAGRVLVDSITRVLVDTAKRGTTFRPPAGQSGSAAKSALWRR